MSPAKTVGVKGSDVYASTGDPRVDLSVSLVRGCDEATIRGGLDAILALNTEEAFEDAFVLAFQTRNIRGGKGERDLFKAMFKHLYYLHTELVTAWLLKLVPKYGCWDDLFQLAYEAECPMQFKDSVLLLAVDQLKADQAALAAGKSVSLCAKWAPREDKMGSLYKRLAVMMHPEVPKLSDRFKATRKDLARLNAASKTTEMKMCAKMWAEIQPKEVPGRCRQKNMKAFLNEPLAPAGGYRSAPSLRRPDDKDRMECREHFQEFLAKAARGEVKMNGADTIYPHEVITRVLKMLSNELRAHYDHDYDHDYGYGYESDDSVEYRRREAAAGAGTADEKNALIAQWKSFVAKAKEGGALTKCLAMCDFSGSMDGLPKLICTALGILVAEVSGTNKILTFDSNPRWHTFPEGDIFTKVSSISHGLGQGTSTDFQKAMDLVLSDIVARRVRPEDVPKDLIVFTDMGWDEACASDGRSSYTSNSYRRNVKTAPWQTHIEMIREAFRRTGEDMWGVPFEPPRIVIWNLRADYKDFHARADQEGVVMLSGWSPSLFKVLQEKGIELATPLQALRAQLDDPMYDDIRLAIRAWKASNSCGCVRAEDRECSGCV
jgi:hypothetical protein